MGQLPRWFEQLKWSAPRSCSDVAAGRHQIPDFPGCYVFLEGALPLSPGAVLYVGQAATSLRSRLANYLVDPSSSRRSRSHKGTGFVLEARLKRTDHGVMIRWVEFGGSRSDLDILEASLIHFLNPQANDRDDDTRHPLLADSDRLHPGLIA